MNERRTRGLLIAACLLLVLPGLCAEAVYRYALSSVEVQRPRTPLTGVVAEAAWLALGLSGPRRLPSWWRWERKVTPDLVAARQLVIASRADAGRLPRRWTLRTTAAAIWIRRNLSADDALALWLERAWFADRVQGLDAAAAQLAGKPAARLDAEEAARLVALAVRPALRSRPGDWKAERDRILRGLAGNGAIDPAQVAEALARPVP